MARPRAVSVMEGEEPKGRGVAAGRDERARTAAHQTRDEETRETEAVREDEDVSWVRGGSLDMPKARPGMDQRWIATAINGKDTPANYRRKIKEGWKPRDPATCSKEWQPQKMDQGKYAGAIMVEGMVLCERPLAIGKRRTEHFRRETQRRTEAINHDLQKINTDNRNPAFGPIKMASETKMAYEKRERAVAVQED